MKEIHVNSSTFYKVVIGHGIRKQISDYLAKTYSSVMIITDEIVGQLYLNDIVNHLEHEKVFHCIVPVGEKSKGIDTFYRLHTEMLEKGLDRNSLVIALGGGVVGDLAGFVAATFMRGIDYVQVPTTILAHDSSVGGKVAINHELGKNLIGNFYNPVAVIYDVETLESLGERETRSGYAEIVKEALISDLGMFDTLTSIQLNSVTTEQLEEHLAFGINVKRKIVEADERESGIRKYLNLGHTLAHALEAELGYGELTHGEAVAIGLLFTLHVSEKEIQANVPFERLIHWMKENHFPIEINHWNVDSLLEKMKTDKKSVQQRIQMVLLDSVGNPVTKEIGNRKMCNYLESFIEKLVK